MDIYMDIHFSEIDTDY